MSEMKNVSSDLRKDFGARLNEFKQFAEAKYEDYKEQKSGAVKADKPKEDMSLPAYPSETGARHPIQQTMNKMIDIFAKIGFTVTEGSGDRR